MQMAKLKLWFGTLYMLALCFTSMCLCACWDREETEHLAIVGAIGIDKGTQNDIMLSVEILNYETLAKGLSQAATKSKVVGWAMREEGTSISNILSNMQCRCPRRCFWVRHTLSFWPKPG